MNNSKEIFDLIPAKYKKTGRLRKSGVAGFFSASLELTKEGLLEIKDDNDFNIIKERSGSSTFPQVFIDGQYIGGYTEFLSYFSSGKHTNS